MVVELTNRDMGQTYRLCFSINIPMTKWAAGGMGFAVGTRCRCECCAGCSEETTFYKAIIIIPSSPEDVRRYDVRRLPTTGVMDGLDGVWLVAEEK